MAVEVLRKLIDGVWRTVVADAGGNGGSQPAITDGTVTVSASEIQFPAGAVTDEGGGVASISFAVFEKTVTLADADIKTLPSTQYEIIPATETLSYSGTPTEMPLPISAVAIINRVSGDGYLNVDPDARLLLVWGSDWSLTASELVRKGAALSTGETAGFFNGTGSPPDAGYATFGGADVDAPSGLTNSLQDNGLYLHASNTSGEFTGGAVGDSLTVTVFYRMLTL